jgi:gliding motility-associated-like protein
MENGTCSSEDREDQTIANIIIQDLTVDLEVSVTDVDKGEEVLLRADIDNTIGLITYDWKGEEQGNIAMTGTEEYNYIADTSDILYVMITDVQTGCEAESNHELVNVLLPIDVPNAFTPNGDGINDTWAIDGLSTYRNSVMKVYNRWGQLVYSNIGVYSNDWDGTRNGKDLSIGTYYYVITLNQDGKTNVSGDVSIIR